MAVNPTNSFVSITQEQFDHAMALFVQIQNLNDKLAGLFPHLNTVETLSARRKAVAERRKLIHERQALLAINGAQYEAVKWFALSVPHPRWKHALRDLWETGRYNDKMLNQHDIALLQQVRNEHGPSWLERFRFPEKKEDTIKGVSVK